MTKKAPAGSGSGTTTVPRWTVVLLTRLAPPGRADDLVGDLEEAHRARAARRGRVVAALLTSLETLEIAFTLLRWRASDPRSISRRRELAVSWLDVKVGLRLLLRYPGLTVVGGLAIAFAICVAVGTFEFVDQVLSPTLPLPGGERIVGVQVRDRESAGLEPRVLHDFLIWREELGTVEELGAFRSLERNLAIGDGPGEPVEAAEISSSAFRVARVAPLEGRALVEADERPGAPLVAVLGHDLWQARFGGDRAVTGRTVRIGDREAIVVGVMPPGFEFPIAHQLWLPLRVDVAAVGPREGPPIRMFGRLAPGVTLEQAQAELATLGSRAAADRPRTHRYLAPEVVPFPRSILDVSGAPALVLLAIDAFVLMLLVLACGNVALLMFARAASRESEIVVRSALGASRVRVVGQMFAEALVLGTVAGAVGLAAVSFGLEWWLGAAEVLLGERLPFWFRSSLSPTSVLYAAGLTLLGALIAGVVPGLRLTGGLHQRLQQRTAGGGGARFGGLWTAVIVAQVAVTVAVPAFAFFVRRDVVQIESVEVGFPEEQVLSARLDLDRDSPPGEAEDPREGEPMFLERFASSVGELEERLTEHPQVTGVTLADRLPRMAHPARLIELDGGGAAPLTAEGPASNCVGSCGGYRVAVATVDLDYFDVLQAPVQTGRGFEAVVPSGSSRPVIVNRSFVERVMGGRNPVGRRLRYVQAGNSGSEVERSPWHDIVGVVRDLGMGVEPDPKVAGVYHPMPPAGTHPVHVAVHVRGDAQAFAPVLREIASRVDPRLRLDDVLLVSEVDDADLRFYTFWFWAVVMVGSIAMILSLAGIYAVMSFTESRRTREIGIRVALGSSRGSIALSVFRRPLLQVSVGVVLGACLAGLLSYGILGDSMWPGGALLVAGYAALMMGVCLLACIVPTRRALSVQPTEALRAE